MEANLYQKLIPYNRIFTECLLLLFDIAVDDKSSTYCIKEFL